METLGTIFLFFCIAVVIRLIIAFPLPMIGVILFLWFLNAVTRY